MPVGDHVKITCSARLGRNENGIDQINVSLFYITYGKKMLLLGMWNNY